MYDFLNTPVEYAKGVGPRRAAVLKTELNVHTFGDLLECYPFRYIDRSKFYKTTEINSDVAYVQIKGKISNIQTIGEGRSKRMTALLKDEYGEIELVWFQGIKWAKEKIIPGAVYVVFGRPNYFNNRYNIAHPELETLSESVAGIVETLQPQYNSSEKLKAKGFNSAGFRRILHALVSMAEGCIPENMTREIIQKYKLISHEEALLNIHFPKSPEMLAKAQSRLRFEELFFVQLRLLKQKSFRTNTVKGLVFKTVGDSFHRFYKEKLPFELTGAQKKVIKEIRSDLGSGRQMNRLLQGDVGSGKTLVALMCMLIAIDNGFQTCLMAPTEILATQHFKSISSMLDGLDLKINLLTGSSGTKKRREIDESLRDGSLNILIGTHALFEDNVVFNNLGLVIIDEQHRFGVAQRARMWTKNTIPPHILVMTATPIPRTLAMTLYGDLDVSVINELPPGRKPIKTYHIGNTKRLRLFGFMREQITQGRQVYVVYPLIKESEKSDLLDLMNGYEAICRAFPLPQYAVSIVHGKMKPADKEFEMQRFVKGETNIMVATTVIEVGVDVPNATMMAIENAERFGLSQLHQLRGRVGRGADQSHCILVTGIKLSTDGKKRIETMVRSNNGFEIAEVDLRLRGPGDMQGTRQSGIVDLHLADIIRDEHMLKVA
ncbi:MAG: ATP-dependent DNA helicase RecG, partial [Bacteroidota bacterium]|nr:ATP-dependent DNA helicase RecG [Bacteroidota bacterium]